MMISQSVLAVKQSINIIFAVIVALSYVMPNAKAPLSPAKDDVRMMMMTLFCRDIDDGPSVIGTIVVPLLIAISGIIHR